ncbi:Transcription initiation factor IIF subunit alpha [Zea mays]|uniref:Transcription initiation factor IIF subunit alpha n=1 Tax=Zea mays TaxID=4577 RepID=A0A3L6EWA2_MAIZE|nr:Transcription initiation factor IIF subunit alpha [Zea mays]
MGSADLVLKMACEGCGNTSDLYGTGCKHTTLCSDCGKSMARSRARCLVCSAPITRLIRVRQVLGLPGCLGRRRCLGDNVPLFPKEYNVRANSVMDKTYSIGRFVTGLPPFSKKKNAENKWSLHKEGLQGRQIAENMREGGQGVVQVEVFVYLPGHKSLVQIVMNCAIFNMRALSPNMYTSTNSVQQGLYV